MNKQIDKSQEDKEMDEVVFITDTQIAVDRVLTLSDDCNEIIELLKQNNFPEDKVKYFDRILRKFVISKMIYTINYADTQKECAFDEVCDRTMLSAYREFYKHSKLQTKE